MFLVKSLHNQISTMTSFKLKMVSCILLFHLIFVISANHEEYTKYREKRYRPVNNRRSYRPPHERDIYEDSYSGSNYPKYDVGEECSGQFMCGMVGYGYYRRPECLDMMLVCDGVRNCRSGSDENSCPLDCHKIGKIPCRDKTTCGNWCDGVIDCPQGEDEMRCPVLCGEGKYQCKGRNEWCISVEKFCNGVNDCPHYEDELHCGSMCQKGQYICEDGKCISKTQVCDGKNDCTSNDDEYNCP